MGEEEGMLQTWGLDKGRSSTVSGVNEGSSPLYAIPSAGQWKGTPEVRESVESIMPQTLSRLREREKEREEVNVGC